MKYLIPIVFILLISCKTDTKHRTTSDTELDEDINMSDTEMLRDSEYSAQDIDTGTNDIVYETEVKIDQSVYDMWDNYTKAHPEFKNNKLPSAEFFHDNAEDANRLAELIKNGKKKASSGLYAWYEELNLGLPKVGTKLIVTDFNGKAKAIVETKQVDTIPFNQISKAYAALDMGTDENPLEKWKKEHWDFFVDTVENPTKDMLVVCEIYETIWPKKQ